MADGASLIRPYAGHRKIGRYAGVHGSGTGAGARRSRHRSRSTSRRSPCETSPVITSRALIATRSPPTRPSSTGCPTSTPARAKSRYTGRSSSAVSRRPGSAGSSMANVTMLAGHSRTANIDGEEPARSLTLGSCDSTHSTSRTSRAIVAGTDKPGFARAGSVLSAETQRSKGPSAASVSPATPPFAACQARSPLSRTSAKRPRGSSTAPENGVPPRNF